MCVYGVEEFDDLKAWDSLRSFAFSDKDCPKLIRVILPHIDSSEEDVELCNIKHILKETMKVPVDCCCSMVVISPWLRAQLCSQMWLAGEGVPKIGHFASLRVKFEGRQVSFLERKLAVPSHVPCAPDGLDLLVGLHGGARGHHPFQEISRGFHGILLNLHPIEAFLCGGTSRALLCSTISAMSKTKKSSLILCGHSFGQVVIAE